MNQRITNTPWHMGLEAWCAQHFGAARQPVAAAAEWAPYEAHKPERFYHVPSVLVVLTSTTEHLHRGFVGAVELLRVSTSGFKAVLVTDMYRSAATELCQWPIEQVVDEALWLRQSSDNWLDCAASQVAAAQQFYGASYVISPTDAADARLLIEHLARAYNVLDSVRDSALEVLQAGTGPEAAAEGFRSGWGKHLGGSQEASVRRELTEYDGAGSLSAEICAGRSGVLLAADELADPGLIDGAARAGWSTVLLAAGDPAPGRNFLAGAVRACADALSLGASGSGLPMVAALPAEWPALPQAAGTLTRGTERHSTEPQSWTLHLPGLGSLVFTTEETAAVLTELSSICG